MMRGAKLMIAISLCSACDSGRPQPAPASTAPPPAASAAAPERPGPEVKPHPALEQRGELAPTKSRKPVLAALTKSGTLLAQKQAKSALETLNAVRGDDPSGAALAAQAARLAKAAEDLATAKRWTTAALVFGQGDERVTRALVNVWGAQESVPALPRASFAASAKDLNEGCAKVRDMVGALHLAFALEGTLSCVQEQTLTLGAEKLRKATVLRVESAGALARQALGWIALDVPEGLRLFGPVAYAVSIPSQGATGDFVVDLQHVDVLSGGAPELVVKVMELSTSVDIALNELAKRDQTRVLLVSADRGDLIASKELVLSLHSGRTALDAKDRAMPGGWTRAKGLGKTAGFDLKVAWGLPNEIRLEKVDGDLTPPDEGSVTLFP